eukprot:TRINITY_DN7049_c0_g5_i1.p1 TRINITY_DN7049_c0_g5~~TRINITY_DN7049_c0_g5_i1.p1  ORF type:complete len:830 (-),score=81.00 TRINITY_DN7049_c0_g5_i1:304-2793(-)
MEQLSFEELLSKLREAHDREVRTAAGGNAHDVSCSSNHLPADLSTCSSSSPNADVPGDSEGGRRGSGPSSPRNASKRSPCVLPPTKSSSVFDIYGDSEGGQGDGAPSPRSASKRSAFFLPLTKSSSVNEPADNEGAQRDGASSPRNASKRSACVLPPTKLSSGFDIFGDSEEVQRDCCSSPRRGSIIPRSSSYVPSRESSMASSSFFDVLGDLEGGHRGSLSSQRSASIIPTNLDRRESQASSRLSTVSTGFSIKISKLGQACSMASSKSGVIGLRPEWTDESRLSSCSDESDDEVELNVVSVQKLKRGWKRQMSAESLDSSKRSLVWGPQSIGRRCLEGVTLMLLLYECCWIPVQIAFNPSSLRVSSAIEYVLTVFWTFDMCLSFNCGYVDHLGREVMDRRLIASRYLKTWFLVDFAVVLPDWIFLVIDCATGQQRSASVGQALSVLRAMRVLRLQKLYRVLHAFEQRLNSSFLLMMFHTWRLVFVLGYIIHLLACVWYIIGTSSTDGWIHGHNLAHTNKLHLYANALFWSMTRFHGESIIDPQTTFEIFFCSFVGFGALLSFSSFVSTVTNMMLSLSRMQEKQTYAAQLLNEYLETHCISVDLSVRAKTCLNSRSSGCEEQVKLDSIGLSKQIIADIKEEANRPFLCGHPLFMAIYKIHGRSLRYICNEACVQKSYAPGEDIFVMDDPCDAMIIQTAGRATYSYDGNKGNGVDETLGKGEWFAEICLWAVWVFRGNLKTESDVSTVEVSVSGFLAMVRTFAPFFSNGFFSRYAQMFLETLADNDAISDRVVFSIAIELPTETCAAARQFGSVFSVRSTSHEDIREID